MPDSTTLSLLSVAPFALLLAAIAIFPLAAPHFWDANRSKALVVAILGLPVALFLLRTEPQALGHALQEYGSFLCLLATLYVVAGGVHVEGDLLATPRHNTLILASGALLANVMGTTGASMLLIHLFLRTNQQRQHVGHLPFFFILIVSNCAGLLTPLGDPPLFLGYLRGVPFVWTLRLWPVWLFAMSYLLGLFYYLDSRAYARETTVVVARDREQAEPLRVTGWMNVGLLVLVVASVFLPSPFREAVMIGLMAVSLWLAPRKPRQDNDFRLGPIYEVAILFAGIFVTMVPALQLLTRQAPSLGLEQPGQFFWLAGALSSVLDNAPTYVTFLSVAQGLGLEGQVVGTTHLHLFAIAAGSVLMGANTYIGNGPNFMVKAIAEGAGYRTASFGAHAFWAVLTLLPIYVFVTVLLAFG
ncbi:MAG TPA: sodium:proton antiporter [Polyangiaceae bacterium]|nr:sodium:proton antiporter [Polyangiaceae bacterium]